MIYSKTKFSEMFRRSDSSLQIPLHGNFLIDICIFFLLYSKVTFRNKNLVQIPEKAINDVL